MKLEKGIITAKHYHFKVASCNNLQQITANKSLFFIGHMWALCAMMNKKTFSVSFSCLLACEQGTVVEWQLGTISARGV